MVGTTGTTDSGEGVWATDSGVGVGATVCGVVVEVVTKTLQSPTIFLFGLHHCTTPGRRPNRESLHLLTVPRRLSLHSLMTEIDSNKTNDKKPQKRYFVIEGTFPTLPQFNQSRC